MEYAESVALSKPRVGPPFAAQPWDRRVNRPPTLKGLHRPDKMDWQSDFEVRVGRSSGTLSEFGILRSITQGFAAKGRETLGFGGVTPSA